MFVNRSYLVIAAFAFIVLLIVAVQKPAAMATAGDAAKSPVTHEEFAAVLKDALAKNPEMIIDSIKAMQAKQKEQTSKEVEKSLDKYSAELMNDTTSPSIGDPKKTDVTLVEFFDYHCGYCKRVLPAITQLHNEDPKVRIIFREFPILAEDSATAARAAIAVNHLYPDKYFAFHTALMNSNGKFDDKLLSDVAAKQNLDWKKIQKEMESADTKSVIEKTRAMAEELGVRGTPAMVIGKQLLPGAVPYDELKRVIANAREGQKAAADSQPKS